MYIANSTHIKALETLMMYIYKKVPFALYLRNFESEAAIIDDPSAEGGRGILWSRVLTYHVVGRKIEQKLSTAIESYLPIIGIDNPSNIFRFPALGHVIPRLEVPSE